MKLWGTMPLLLQLLFWGLGAPFQDSDCVLVQPCTCLLQGSHQVINLAAVGPVTVPLDPDKESGGVVRFSPCQPFSEPANLTPTDCVRVASCMTLRQADPRTLPRHIAYGRHQKTEFQYNDSTGVLTVTYPVWPSSPLSTLAHFNCSPVGMMAHVSLLPTQLEIFIHTPCACPDHCRFWGPEPSPVIAISFFVTLGIYLLWGIYGLPVIYSRGNQLIPPDQLWGSPCSCCLRKLPSRESIPLIGISSGT